MNCGRNGCPHEACWQVRWKVWPLSIHQAVMVPSTIDCGLVVCDDHKNTVILSELCPPDSRAHINNELTKARKQPLDFATAKIEYMPVIAGRLVVPAPKKNIRIT